MNETNAGGVRQRSVEIVVPVRNEAHVLGDSIGRLHAYLEASFPFPFRITVADNASTDATWQAATELTGRHPHVHAVHLEAKGRGRALAGSTSSPPPSTTSRAWAGQRRILTGRTRVALPPRAGTAHVTAAAAATGGVGSPASADRRSSPAGLAAPPAGERAA
jgi:hypothetical protein